MSSANLIAHRYIQEQVFGELPPATRTWQDVGKTSAAFSGTPDVTQSSTIRSDRLPSGNIITGLTVGATLDTEFARSVVHDDFLEATMMTDWPGIPAAIGPIDVTFTASTGVLTSTAGGLSALSVGSVFTISGMTGAAADYNTTTVFVVSVATDDNTITVVTSSNVVDFTDAAASLQAGDCLQFAIERGGNVHLTALAFAPWRQRQEHEAPAPARPGDGEQVGRVTAFDHRHRHFLDPAHLVDGVVNRRTFRSTNRDRNEAAVLGWRQFLGQQPVTDHCRAGEQAR